MRREGSPWTGLGAVFLKEFSDHLSSVRMRVLEWLMIIVGVGTVFAVIRDIKTVTFSDRFLFLRLFTLSHDPLPSLLLLLTILIPLIALLLGFDAVNSEFNRRTMSRVLSQPVYRDAVLLGKVLAGLATLGVSLTVLWLLVIGLGLVLLGVPPSGEEVARALAVLVVALAYAGVWLAAAILFSVIFRSAATAALCALGLWFTLSLLWSMVVSFLVDALAPNDMVRLLGMQTVEQAQYQQILSRLSPNNLFVESVMALLEPSTRSLGLVFPTDLIGAVPNAPLPFLQSLLIAWPQITALVAIVILLFALTYVLFQRQEIRA
jgi:ABC-2 type transport system permease protein